jgi:hypothetical protein
MINEPPKKERIRFLGGEVLCLAAALADSGPSKKKGGEGQDVSDLGD